MVYVEIWYADKIGRAYSNTETFDKVMEFIKINFHKRNIDRMVIFNEWTDNKVGIYTDEYNYFFKFTTKQWQSIREDLTKLYGKEIERR